MNFQSTNLPLSARHPIATLYRLAVILAATCLITGQDGISIAHAQGLAQDLEAVVSESGDDFKTFLKSTKETSGKLDKVTSNLNKADRGIRRLMNALPRNDPRRKQLKKALRAVRTMQNSVQDYNGKIKLFNKSGGRVKEAFDLYDKVLEMRDRAAKRRGGKLAGQLSILADVMKDYGEKVPILGKALAAYGQITGDLLNATDKLAAKLAKQRKQGIIGGGTGQNLDDPRYLKLKQQYPDLADYTLIPVGPRFVFEEYEAKKDGASFIWDEDKKEWYIAGGELHASRIFSDGLTIGKRFTAKQLAYLTDNSDKIVARKKTAARFMEILTKKYKGLNYDKTMIYLDGKFGRRFKKDGDVLDYFLAQYAYDGRYQQDLHTYAAVMWARAHAAERSTNLIKALEVWAQKAGFKLKDALPPEEKAFLENLIKKRKQAKQPATKKKPACKEWKVARYCAKQERFCEGYKTSESCIRWKGNISSPKCAEWKTYTRCKKWKWKCVDQRENRYCNKK